jgi:hypothetical protein
VPLTNYSNAQLFERLVEGRTLCPKQSIGIVELQAYLFEHLVEGGYCAPDKVLVARGVHAWRIHKHLRSTHPCKDAVGLKHLALGSLEDLRVHVQN